MHGRQAHEVPGFQRRLDRQADSTRGLRMALYDRLALHRARTVLDVGCGTGGVTLDLVEAASQAQVIAVDVDPQMVRRAARRVPVLGADGRSLPFPDGSFDVVACNLVLMWTPEPERFVAEMARVARPGGLVLASMEPDYGGKVHWPANPLIDLVFQGEGVRRRGGDPHAGRKLRAWFTQAGLQTEVGILNQEVLTPDQDLAVFRRNRMHYRRLLAESGFAAEAIDAWEEEYLESLSAGIQLSYLPLFYAAARKPTTGPTS